MKKRTLQTVAVLIAFFIGVAINYSCGDSYPTVLGNGGGSSHASNGEFDVDGLWFDRSGRVISKLKESCSESSTHNYKFNYNYEYDEYGRVVKYTYTTTLDNGTLSQNITEYKYNGKVVTTTSTSTSVNGDKSTSTSTAIYY